MIERERLVLIGHPVSQSLSPLMHNAALEAKGSSVRYEAMDVLPENLEAVLAELSHTRSGGNLTIPHKKTALKSMRVISDVAHSVGAVNTFWSDGYGGIDGDNTDVVGFNESIRELMGRMPSGIRVAVIGAGGAAAAALTAIDQWTDAVNRGTLHILDGGQLSHSAPSTVVDCTGRRPRVIRPGAISSSLLRESVPDVIGDN